MLFEAIPLLFFYLFTSVFSGAKCSIAAVSSGLPPLFHSMEFLLPAFLRTADPGLLFFQENSFCTFLIHRFYRLYGKNSAVLRLFHPDFSFHHTVFRACRKAEVIALPRGKPADLFPQHPAALRADNICHPLLLHRLFLCLKHPGHKLRVLREPQCELLILALRRQIIIHGHIIFHGIKIHRLQHPPRIFRVPQCPVERRVHIKRKGLHRFIKRNSRLSVLIAQAVQFLDIIKKERFRERDRHPMIDHVPLQFRKVHTSPGAEYAVLSAPFKEILHHRRKRLSIPL